MAQRPERMKIIQDAMARQSFRRKMSDKIFTGAAIASVIIAMIPLGSILIEVVKNGASVISAEFLTAPQGSIVTGGGGIGPAIQGTLLVVGYASLIAVPVGVLAGIYLSEYASSGKFAYVIRFLNNVMTGMPSIVIGIVGYIVLVI